MRDSVAEFAEAMENKLRKRDGYGGWIDLPLDYLKAKLEAELFELMISLKHEPSDEVMGECVDVANYCLFIWDVMRSRQDVRENLIVRKSKEDVHALETK